MDGLSQVRWSGDQAVVVLPEHLDVSGTGQLREVLLSVINRGARVVIADMSATVSCDLGTADAFARAHQRAKASGTELRLVVSHGLVRRVLGLSGVDRLVSVYPSLEAAGAAQPPGLAAPSRSGADSGVADVGTEAALLDLDGVIVSVNQAWLDFAAGNGGDPARTGPGVSYLEVCAAAVDDPAAAEVAEAIRAALAGDLPGPMVIEVPCPSPSAERWYEVLISSRPGRDGLNQGAAVTLSLARSRLRSQPAGLGAGLHLVRGPGRPSPAGTAQRVPPPGADVRAAGSVSQSPAVVTPGVLVAAIEAMNDGIALIDSNGTVMLASRRLEEMFGYPHAELRGQPVEQLVPRYLRDAHRRHRAGYHQAPAARPMEAGARLVGLRKDGSTFPAEISLSPAQASTGRFTLTVVRDVTAGRREELAGPAGAAREAASNDVLDDVVSSLYHVGLSLRNTAQQDKDTVTRRIAEALSRIDETIQNVRAAAVGRHDQDP